MPPKEVKPCPTQVITDCGGKYFFDLPSAERAREFFENLRHVKGPLAGKPFKLEPWQWEGIIKPLFGWKKKSNGKRRFRRAYIQIPKKNGKSTLCAAIALYMLGADRELSAEVYSAATERAQAAIVFKVAKDMLRNSPVSRFFRKNRNTITVPRLGSVYVAVSKDTKAQHGLNTHCLIFDELHALKDAELYEVMTDGSSDAREQPLHITITTAGADRTSICYEEYIHAKEVLKDETADEEMLAVIYEPGEHDDWRDPRVWAKVNPNLGISIQPEIIAAACKRAQKQPRKENSFKRLRLNMWTSSVTRWLSSEDWDKCGRDYKPEDLKGKICYGGLDLSSTIDLAAFGLLFSEPDGLYELTKFFMPEDRIEEASERDGVPYNQWVKEGLIIATPGNVIDYEAIVAEVERAKAFYELQEVGFDPYNATMIVQVLEKRGVKMVPVAQSFKGISSACKEFERQVMLGSKGQSGFRHSRNKVLTWNASNIEVRTGPGGIIAPHKPVENRGRQKKIDGVVALIIAQDRIQRQEKPQRSKYEDEDLTTL